MDRSGRPDTINPLLDIEKFSGEHSKRMGPTLLFIAVAGAPLVAFLYFLLWRLPVWIFLVFYVPYVIRVSLVILGEEAKRLKQFKAQLYGVYSSINDILNIKDIHADGMVEYLGNTVAYFLVATNGETEDVIDRAKVIKKLLSSLSKQYTVDIYIQNALEETTLSDRYSGVKLFNDEDVARDFLDLIDYNRTYIKNESLVTRVIYVVQGRRSEYRTMKEAILTTMNSSEAKVFRTLRIADKAEVESILNRDVDTYVDFPEVQRQKYADGEYHGSRVIKYDYHLKPKDDEEQKEDYERGFMVSE